MNKDAPHIQNSALVTLCMALLPVWGRQLASSCKQSEAAVHEMLAAFAQISPHLDMASSTLGPHIDRLYQGLQYQDRISQMMVLLQEDMQRLHTVIADPNTVHAELMEDAWLARLESQYAMAEQRHHHQTPPLSAHNGPGIEPTPETDFF